MRFDRSFIDEVKRKVDLVELIERHVPLKKVSSKEMEACCPFHDEKTPSFTVPTNRTNEDSFYHCFGCGAHGGAIDFVQEYQGLNFVESIKYLCEEFNIQLPDPKKSKERSAAEKKQSSRAFALCSQLWKELPESKIEGLNARIITDSAPLILIASRFKSLKDHLFKSGSMRGLRNSDNSTLIPIRLKNDAIVGFHLTSSAGATYVLPIHPEYRPIDFVCPVTTGHDYENHYAATSLELLTNIPKGASANLIPSFNSEITERQYKGLLNLGGETTLVLPGNKDLKAHFKMVSSLIDRYEPGDLIKLATYENATNSKYLFDHLESVWPSLPLQLKDYFTEKLAERKLHLVIHALESPISETHSVMKHS